MMDVDFLPAGFVCSDAVRRDALEKLVRLHALAEELPAYIVHDVRDFSLVYMSPKGLRPLGYTLDELRAMGECYFTIVFNEHDAAFYVPKFKRHLVNPNTDQWFSFLQQVMTGKAGEFEWYLSACRPLVYDEEGNPVLSLTFALKMQPNHRLAEKAEQLMEENLFLMANRESFASLTKRERQLLACIAAGETPDEIVDKLFISAKTLKTHRQNIKRKIGAKTQVDMVKFAQAFNLV